MKWTEQAGTGTFTSEDGDFQIRRHQGKTYVLWGRYNFPGGQFHDFFCHLLNMGTLPEVKAYFDQNQERLQAAKPKKP
jgi:hypothetical protein